MRSLPIAHGAGSQTAPALSAVELARRFPHTFTLQYPPSRAYFRQYFRTKSVVDTSALTDVPSQLLLYVHIPFCVTKCHYCNFAVDLRKDSALQHRYARTLARQLTQLAEQWPSRSALGGIDIGGGTPTLLPSTALETVLLALDFFRARTTVQRGLSIESTPSIVVQEPEKLRLLRAHGFERISLGVQSTEAETLAQMNRRAQKSLGVQALETAVAAGFERVNADLVFGLPEQSLEAWLQDLRRVLATKVTSITLYDCLYRGENRAFSRWTAQRPSPKHYAILYDEAFALLHSEGFLAPYGSANFSRISGETGTSAYFEGRLRKGLSYVGVGNYASSLLNARWWFAPYTVEAWEAALTHSLLPYEDCYDLPPEELAAKHVLLALHFGQLSHAHFHAHTGLVLEQHYAEALACALREGWLEATDDGFAMVRGQYEHFPALRSLFYPARAVQWLQTDEGRRVLLD